MDGSSLAFITCDELRNEFDRCRDDNQKRIMIFDVRDESAFDKSHLCLDARNKAIRSQVRVFNIDPDRYVHCTIKNILNRLSEDDARVFKLRKHANDAIIIERHTDDISQLKSPKSKVMRLIRALTTLDTQTDSKLAVPIKILEGGYREWWMKYSHFTTNPQYDPDDHVETTPSSQPPSTPSSQSSTAVLEPLSNHLPVRSPLSENGLGITIDVINAPLSPQTRQPPSKPLPINKPVPTPPQTTTSIIRQEPIAITQKPPVVKIAPGTAVPMTPNSLLIRPTLPRSHSSPNVAQADGDDFEDSTNQLAQLTIGKGPATTINNNHVAPSAPQMPSKPRFDRTLKPAFNNEFINAIRSQINFGCSPEASVRANTGLQNLGNTCFMNSVIQCLAYVPDLVAYFCSNNYYKDITSNEKHGTNGRLAVEFGSLVEMLNSERYKYIEPKSFRDAVTKHIGFAGNEQQDSHEFMMMLFDKLHHDLNKAAKERGKQQAALSNNDDSNHKIPRATLGYQFWRRHLELNRSVISELFEGIFMSTLTCTACMGQSNTFEVFNCLSLPIPTVGQESRCHLRDCLSHFSKPERIEAAWECPNCKLKRAADKKIVICKLPKLLIVHLKRFSLVDGIFRKKLQTTVDFPLNDLSVDCADVLPQSAYEQVGIKSSYNLFACVNHYGHLDGGHYTAYCKMKNNRWFRFDDRKVTLMRDVDVCGQAAYILFYAASP